MLQRRNPVVHEEVLIDKAVCSFSAGEVHEWEGLKKFKHQHIKCFRSAAFAFPVRSARLRLSLLTSQCQAVC